MYRRFARCCARYRSTDTWRSSAATIHGLFLKRVPGTSQPPQKFCLFDPSLPEVSPDHLQIYQDILKQVRPYIQKPYTPEWIAVKLMEGDPEVSKIVEKTAPKSVWDKIGRPSYQA